MHSTRRRHPDTPTDRTDRPLLAVENLGVRFRTRGGSIQALDGVSWTVAAGQTVALVGESGCGKSTAALALTGLIAKPSGQITAGRVWFQEQDLLRAPHAVLQRIRGRKISTVFQEPLTSLNPVLTVGDQVAEAAQLYHGTGRPKAWSKAVQLLDQVGLPEPRRIAKQYPHQLSGGMCQRAMIAMAIAGQPALLVADEPTTALDVYTQAQILELLRHLQTQAAMAILLITHDLGIVAQMANYVYVMYAGRIVEHSDVEELFGCPLHPYTQGLMQCIVAPGGAKRRLATIRGQPPDPRRLPSGCRFHPRCGLAQADASVDHVLVDADGTRLRVLARCTQETPNLRELRPGHWVACHLSA